MGRGGERSLPKPSPSLDVFTQVLKSLVYLYSRLVILGLQVGGEHTRALEADLCVWFFCVWFFFLFCFLAVLGSGAKACWTLGRQQRGLKGAGSSTLTMSEHLAGEMVKGVMSFWGGTDPSVRRCRKNTDKHSHK